MIAKLRTTITKNLVRMSILDDVTFKELDSIIAENPYLRGYLQGYIAEFKLMNQLRLIPGVTKVEKIPDVDSIKADIKVEYRGKIITIEVKSIKTDSVKDDVLNDTWEGTVSFKNTDKRDIEVEGLGVFSSYSLKKGEFDILAISCFAVSGKWEFIFIENQYLPEKSFTMPGYVTTSFIVNPSKTPCVEVDALGVLESIYNASLSLESGAKIEEHEQVA